jgi:photosystem II stability/assembly factor-like uncharacterized protein
MGRLFPLIVVVFTTLCLSWSASIETSKSVAPVHQVGKSNHGDPHTKSSGSTSVYAAMYSYGLGISHDDGQTWNSSKLSGGANGVSVASEKIFAASSSNLYSSDDDGQIWGTPLSSGCNCVFSISNGWVFAGSNGNGVAISKDSGLSWQWVDTSSGLPSNYVYAIYAQADGSWIYAGTDKGLGISEDGGNTWRRCELLNNDVKSVFAMGKEEIYVGTSGGLAITKDGGQTWGNHLTSYTVQSIFVTTDTIYIGTPSDGMAISNDEAQTWVWVDSTTGLLSNSVNSIKVLGDRIYLATSTGLSISEDGGSTWLTRGLPDNRLNDVFVVDG